MKKDDIIELEIEDLSNLGSGVGRHGGMVVFVNGAVFGDRVRAKLIKVTASFAVARLLEILSPSPVRIESDPCTAPMSCGGCVYRHVTYEEELRLKTEYVRNAFKKAGLDTVLVLPALSAGKVYGYRNKGQYPVAMGKEGLYAGFYAQKTHNIIQSTKCAIQSPSFAPIVDFVCSFGTDHGWTAYDEGKGEGLLRHIYLRIGEKTGQIMLCLVINGETLPNLSELARQLSESFPEVKSLMLNINKRATNVVLGERFVLVSGKPYIEDELCGLRFRISPDSFYQVNRDGAELLYSVAREMACLSGGETLMDLYCGTGTIGLSMASGAGKLCGVEIVSAAVECAKENAERNGIENAVFFCDDASDGRVILNASGGECPDVAVIDPPRKGTTRALAKTLADIGVPRVVYVSCDADTLARDCVYFSELGYTVGRIQPVDMFPRTGHIECVVALTRHIQ